MGYMTKGFNILKKCIMVSGAIARVLTGIGASAILVISMKKKKAK